ncbi:MAG: DUF998 domain-containing protein, partial [Chloroflexales bacterium]|nr:DUF998 domain-containing protein [Chloroflexales bacterium]
MNIASRHNSSLLSAPAHTSPGVRWIARASLGLVGYTAVAIVALHLLRADLNPIEHFVSEYAVGAFGPVMTSAFITWGLGILALIIGLFRSAAPGGRSWVGSALMLIWAVVL